MADRSRSWGLFAWVLVLGCAEGEGPPQLAVAEAELISGSDDRWSPEDSPDQPFAQAARGFVAALVLDTRVVQDDQGDPYLDADPLYTWHSDEAEAELCRDERFALEPTPAFCSGTLIAPDLLLTAGHCVTSGSDCEETAVVFGFEADGDGEVQPLELADIYACAELIVQSEPDYPDYAVLRLDRPVMGRQPAMVVRDERSLPLREGIAIAGHPLGLPLKISTDGRTRPIAFGHGLNEPDYFGVDIDSFPGNSGSGGFLSATEHPYPLVGVLSSVIDIGGFYYDEASDCERYDRHPEVMVWLTYAHHAIAALCDDRGDEYPALCSCGDGQCTAAYGENGTSCATDCDDACGDQLCFGSETPASCAADCACGDGTCGAGEECCADCGCDAGFACEAQACVPALVPGGAGSDCSHARPLPVAPVTMLEGATRRGLDNNRCGSAPCEGPDEHYTFTLDEPTSITATASGFQYLALELRTAACSGGESLETAADRNGRGTARLHHVLPAGTYRLVVDGERSFDHGDYALEVRFASPPVIEGDDCSEPIVLAPSGSYAVSGSTASADNDRGAVASEGCGARAFGNDRFYAFTLTEKTRLEASVNAAHDATLLLTQGDCGSVIRCAQGDAEIRRVLDPGTYLLVVDGAESFDSGPYMLSLEFITSPPLEGESCEDALAITPSGTRHVSGSLDGLADDFATPCGSVSGADRVYTFTLAATRTLLITADGPSGAYVNLSEGCTPAAGSPCLALGGEPRTQNRTLEPGTYFLVIDGADSIGGDYDVSIDFESLPRGEACSDALPLAIGATPATVTRAGHESAASADLFYAFTLAEPSRLVLDADSPAAFWLTSGLDTIYRSSGKLEADVPAGKYCVHLRESLGEPAFRLTASATALDAPAGRGCDDSIPIEASGGHVLSSYASFGRLGTCSPLPAQLYDFALTEATRVRAKVTSGFALAVFSDGACVDLAQCSTSSGSIDASLPAGEYKLAIAGPPFVRYDLKLGFACDPDECAIEPPAPEDAGMDSGEPEPVPDAAVDGGVIAPSPDSGTAPDAMVVEPEPDSGDPEPTSDGGAPDDAGPQPDAADQPASSSGCACATVTARPTSPRTLLWLAAFGLITALRLKRRMR